MEAIELGDCLVLDELLAGSNTHSPVRVYIPRKPHPNGHLYYFAATYFETCKKWFICNCDPYIEVGNRPVFLLVFRLFTNITEFNPNNDELNVFADSKFATLKNIDYCLNNNI